MSFEIIHIHPGFTGNQTNFLVLVNQGQQAKLLRRKDDISIDIRDRFFKIFKFGHLNL